MPEQDKPESKSPIKKIVFPITKQLYENLLCLQQKGGYSALSPFMRMLIKNRKVKIIKEAYCLDRVMGVLTALNDALAFMELDFSQMESLLKVPPETPPDTSGESKRIAESLPDYAVELRNLTSNVDLVHRQLIPLTALIAQLSKLWLPI